MARMFIVQFAQAHPEFRLPELQSVAEICDIQLIKPENENWDTNKPFWIMTFRDETQANAVARRCVLVKSIYELYGRGKTYEEVHAQTKETSHLWSCYVPETTFRFVVSAYNHSIPQSRQIEVVESFKFMDLRGKIVMKDPEITLAVWEEYTDRGTDTLRTRDEGDGDFDQVFFGRLIANGTARSLMRKFDVKKRLYYGNTSMEAEMSLLMANQTLAAPGKFIHDPFVGTGSMAYTVAHFGALFFGSDIDGRQMRGKENHVGIMRAASQYGVAALIVDLCTFDVTRNPWRCGDIFDAIVTDPPYGVRAGAKRLGRKNTGRRANNQSPRREAQSKALEPYVPPTKPYELSNLVVDLVLLARYLMKPGGRLVFFLPTVTDEYEELDIQTMLCEGMEVVANSLQDFGSWGRRLITIKKVTSVPYKSPFEDAARGDGDPDSTEIRPPAHKDFREKYFRGFKSERSQGAGV